MLPFCYLALSWCRHSARLAVLEIYVCRSSFLGRRSRNPPRKYLGIPLEQTEMDRYPGESALPCINLRLKIAQGGFLSAGAI
jgi:hypothetical protein